MYDHTLLYQITMQFNFCSCIVIAGLCGPSDFRLGGLCSNTYELLSTKHVVYCYTQYCLARDLVKLNKSLN